MGPGPHPAGHCAVLYMFCCVYNVYLYNWVCRAGYQVGGDVTVPAQIVPRSAERSALLHMCSLCMWASVGVGGVNCELHSVNLYNVYVAPARGQRGYQQLRRSTEASPMHRSRCTCVVWAWIFFRPIVCWVFRVSWASWHRDRASPRYGRELCFVHRFTAMCAPCNRHHTMYKCIQWFGCHACITVGSFAEAVRFIDDATGFPMMADGITTIV